MFSLSKEKTFRGGVHPPEYKNPSKDKPFEIMPLPTRIIVPLSQHLGKPAVSLVKKGSEVKTGTVIAEAQGVVSSPIHSPVTGKVTAVTTSVNSSGFPKESIIIEPSENEEFDFLPILNHETISSEEIIERVRLTGIVGQGGAAFPASVKLSPPKDKKIDYIILNGCECEPYLTRDYRYMLEQPEVVLAGLQLIMKATGVDKGIVGIEDNKPLAIESMKKAAKTFNNISVEAVETKYPQGAEKMLIKALTNREVPPGKLPLDSGIIVQNIGTAVSIYLAVVKGEPSITAALTITGNGIKESKNLIVRVGTPIDEVLNYCGGVTDDAIKVVVGGPMMGVSQYDFSAPVMKATSGILVLTKEEVSEKPETPCLRCGKCVEACPVNLIPTKLARYSQLGKIEEAEALDIRVCMECGTCAYTCPANIPLVQWIRLGKKKVMEKVK